MSNKTKFNEKNKACFTCVRDKIESVYSVVGWTSVVERSWASDLLEIVESVQDGCSGYRDPAPFDHASTVQSDNISLDGSDDAADLDRNRRSHITTQSFGAPHAHTLQLFKNPPMTCFAQSIFLSSFQYCLCP